MAEERILIFDVGDQCAYRSEASVSYFAKNGEKIGTQQELVCHREDNWGAKCDDKWCEKCDKKHFVGMKRQEAIEKMAKALHKESVRISNMEKDFDKLPAGWRKSFYNYAEAALNALLGK